MSLVVFGLVSMAFAEPPVFQSNKERFVQFSRQELTTTDVPTTTDLASTYLPPVEGPYPASGWRPSGPAFELPTPASVDPRSQGDNPEAETIPPIATVQNARFRSAFVSRNAPFRFRNRRF